MGIIKKWLARRKFAANLLAFLLMVLPAIGLYSAAEWNATGWIWALLGVVVAANLLAIALP
jgi:hypothetical protein